MSAITEYELNQLEALAEQRHITQSVAFQLAIAAPDLLEAIRTQRTALIAWQFQAAGAALENQRLRERVEAWEWLDEVETLYGNLGWSFDRKQCAIDEMYATLVAARAAIGEI